MMLTAIRFGFGGLFLASAMLTAPFYAAAHDDGEPGHTHAAAKPPTAQQLTVARQLIDATGGAEMGQQLIDHMLMVMRRQLPDVEDAYWIEAREQLTFESLINELSLIYAEHFTVEEMRGLIAFYESPLGQRFLEEQPHITQKSTRVGQRWGQAIAQRIAQEIQERGESILQSQPPAAEAAPDTP